MQLGGREKVWGKESRPRTPMNNAGGPKLRKQRADRGSLWNQAPDWTSQEHAHCPDSEAPYVASVCQVPGEI